VAAEVKRLDGFKADVDDAVDAVFKKD